MEKIMFYLVDFNETVHIPTFYSPDEEFIKEATRQGHVYNLQAFQSAFNAERINTVNMEMRAISAQSTNADTIEISWHVDDVKMQAQESGYDITDHDAHEILMLIKHKHDATIGINWDVISTWIAYYVAEQRFPNTMEELSEIPVRSNFELVREFMINRFDELTPEQELSLQKYCCTHLEDSDIDGVDNDLTERGFKEWYQDNYPNGHIYATCLY